MQTKTHFKTFLNKEYLGSWDLPNGQDIIGTISKCGPEKVIGADGKKEDCFVIHFADVQKPMICNVTNSKMIAKVVGSPYIEDWLGKKIQIGSEKVRAFGDVVDALRVGDNEVADAKPIFCEDCGQPIQSAYGMNPEQLANYTKNQYGKQLCAVCATKAKEARDEA